MSSTQRRVESLMALNEAVFVCHTAVGDSTWLKGPLFFPVASPASAKFAFAKIGDPYRWASTGSRILLQHRNEVPSSGANNPQGWQPKEDAK